MDNVITIDGPAGAGKTSISRLLAKKLGCVYLDTGAMYRAVALGAKRANINFKDGRSLGMFCQSIDLYFKSDCEPQQIFLNGENISSHIRTHEMDLLSSDISAVREVRDSMAILQKKMANNQMVVVEGRDMGTVVFPNAKYKFYLTALPQVRAERRYSERIERGENITFSQVAEDLNKRDLQDSTRSLAPLKPAEDAEIIDSTLLSIDEIVGKIMNRME